MRRNLLYRLAYPFRRYKWVCKQPNIFSLPKRYVLKANRCGFTAAEYVIYNLDKNDYHDYLSEFERHEFRKRVASEYKILLDNKVIFNTLVKNFVKTNEIIFYKKSSLVMLSQRYANPEDVIANLREKGRVVYKKMADGGGHGVKFFDFSDNSYKINGVPCQYDDIMSLLEESDNYFVEEYCEQSDFENILFPYSVNTLRLVTIESENGYEIAYALQRIGADKKSMVDNASGGVFFQKSILKLVA